MIKNLIPIAVVLLLITWSIGYFVYDAKPIIHLLVFLSITGLIYDLVNKSKKVK